MTSGATWYRRLTLSRRRSASRLTSTETSIYLTTSCSVVPSLAVHADTDVNILEFNTQFFFDHQVPHGSVVGTDADQPIPTEAEWKQKAQDIANVINNSGANIVGLVEVENETVVEEVAVASRRPLTGISYFEPTGTAPRGRMSLC